MKIRYNKIQNENPYVSQKCIIELTKRMMEDGLAVVTNPTYLKSKLADKSSEEIKKMRQDDGQLTPAAQREMSLRGDRLGLIEFHRFVYELTDDEIKRLWNAKKQHWIDNKLGEDKYTYCDVNLFIDAIQYQICIRDETQFDMMIADEIARSFRHNVKITADFPEITSQHMLSYVKNLIEKYSKKAADFQTARETLGFSQAALAEKLGWSSVRQVSNIETGARPVQKQTGLAVECLLRRTKKWNIYKKMKKNENNA